MAKFLRKLLKIKKPVPNGEVLLPQLDSFFAGRLIEGAIQDRRPFLASRLGWMESYALGLWDTSQPVEQSFIDKLRRHAGVFRQRRTISKPFVQFIWTQLAKSICWD